MIKEVGTRCPGCHRTNIYYQIRTNKYVCRTCPTQWNSDTEPSTLSL